MSLKTSVQLHVVAKQVQSGGDLGTAPDDELDLLVDVLLRDGSGVGQANKMYRDSRNLSASASENLDLSGVLTDAFGNVLAISAVKLLIVRAKATNANDVVLGGAAANPWTAVWGATGTALVKPGAVHTVIAGEEHAGYPVVAGTGDQLKVLNGGAGTAVDYDIIVVGV